MAKFKLFNYQTLGGAPRTGFFKPGDKVHIERDCAGTLEYPLEQGN